MGTIVTFNIFQLYNSSWKTCKADSDKLLSLILTNILKMFKTIDRKPDIVKKLSKK